MRPSPEAIEEWRAHPVTEWLLDTFLAGEMRRTKRAFQEAAWASGVSDETRAVHLERYETLEWIRALDNETIDHALESQGEREGK